MTDVKNEAPLIQLTDAIVRRDGKNILEVDSFVLHSGENIALLGPNGAGKSTFIRLITREDFPLYRDNPPVLFRGNDRTTLQETKKARCCFLDDAGSDHGSSSCEGHRCWRSFRHARCSSDVSRDS